MNKAAIILVAAAVALAAACSKTEPQAKTAANTASSVPAANQVDYKKICEHMVPLAPEARRVVFAQSCEADYRGLLPSCRNAAAVTDCYTHMKSWDERLACMDSCVRDAAPEKK